MCLFPPELTGRDGLTYIRLGKAHWQTQVNRNVDASISSARDCWTHKKIQYCELSGYNNRHDKTHPCSEKPCGLPFGTSGQEFPVSLPSVSAVVQFLPQEYRAAVLLLG